MGKITILNLAPYDLQPVPELDKEYHAFDDGKVKPSRHSIATVTKIIPFAEADAELLDDWRQNVEESYWLYAPETDYFIRAAYDDTIEHFVRTTDGGWFSIGWFGARLDVTGQLYKNMIDFYCEPKED
jgi:RimJ/RimL family protein N-acetyltransferase